MEEEFRLVEDEWRKGLDENVYDVDKMKLNNNIDLVDFLIEKLKSSKQT